jgi:hypothetical protein
MPRDLPGRPMDSAPKDGTLILLFSEADAEGGVPCVGMGFWDRDAWAMEHGARWASPLCWHPCRSLPFPSV